MTEASYTAWDDKQYVWPPPEGWYQASDGKWWPEGYGPQPTPPIPEPSFALGGESAGDQGAGDQGAGDQGAGDQGAGDKVGQSDAGIADAAQDVVEAEASGVANAAEGVADRVSGEAGGLAAGAAAAAGGLAGGAAAAAGRLGEAAEEVLPEVDLGGAATDAAAKNPGAGAFDSPPMEMNDLSTGSAAALGDRADALTEKVGEFSAAASEAADLDVDSGALRNAALPEVGSLPGVDDLAGVGSLPGVDDLPGVEDLPTTDDLPGVEDLPTTDDLPRVEDLPNLAQDLSETRAVGLPDPPAHAAPVGETMDPRTAGPDWAGAPAPESGLWGDQADAHRPIFDDTSNFEEAQAYQQGGFDSPNPNIAPTNIAPTNLGPSNIAPTNIAPTNIAPTNIAPNAVPPAGGMHVDPQDILHAKPKGSRSKRWLLVLLGALLLAAACAAAYWFIQNRETDTPAEAALATGPGSAAQPHARDTGVVVFYPDGEVNQRWVVEVLEPVRDASDEFAGAPAAGDVFAATRIRVRNESGVDGASLGDLEFNAVNAAGELIRREDNQCETSGQDLDYDAAVNLGTVLEGTVCWEIPADQLDGLKLGVESNKVAGRVHIALN